jgi:hypothetical protein
MRATCPAYVTVIDLVILLISGEEYTPVTLTVIVYTTLV